MDRKYHWIAGFIIYSALLALTNYFINYALNATQVIIFAVLSYAICIFSMMQRKWIARLLGLFILLASIVYILDGILETLLIDEITFQNELIQQVESGDIDLNQNEPSSGFTAHQSIHSLRQTLDYQHVVNFVNWLTDTRKNDSLEFNGQYERVLFILISFGLAFVLQLIMKYRYSKSVLIMPFFAFIWMWYHYIDLPRSIYTYYFIGVFIFYVLDRQDDLKRQTQSYGQKHYKTKSLFLFSVWISLAVTFVTLFVTAVFPLTRVNQLTDPFVPNLWGGRTAYSTESIKMYTLNDTPYQSHDNQLGGPIKDIDRETVLFWIKTEPKQSEALYLKGNIKDYFDGYQWLSHANTYKKAYEFFLSEPRNLKYINSEDLNKISGIIKLEKMKTVTLFSPMGLYETSLGDAVYVSIDNEAFYKAGAFVKFLETYQFTSANKDFSFSKEVDYLQLPDHISNGTYQLARNLANYGLSDYEKMVVMTNFLIKNYDYTLYPPEYDKEVDRDFVSEFIFETRAGYCTYFATALTVMARINEIPARYVEGFRIDPNMENEDGFNAVTEGEAHAWCEVYLEDKGWVIFESTPPYASAASSLNRSSDNSMNALIDDAEYDALPQSSQEVNAFKESLLDEQMIMDDDGGESGGVKPDPKIESMLGYRQVVMWIAISGVGISLLIMLIYAFINLSVIRPNGTRRSVLRMVNYMTYLLIALNPQKGHLLDHLIDETSLEAEAQMKIFTLVYNSRSHFDTEMISEVTQLLEKTIQQLEKQYKAEFGFLKLAYVKIFNLRKIVL